MPATITTTDHSLLRLLQLSSATLPVGSYSFSQGLEHAVEIGWITDEQQTAAWMELVVRQSIAKVDLPILWRLAHSLETCEIKNFWLWDTTMLACRETKELLLNETAMGAALVRLLKPLLIELPDTGNKKLSFLSAFVYAGHH
ncbi:MAG: urease accessory protein [Cellvibrionaceae bacterium]|jgi:urease accessory protein